MAGRQRRDARWARIGLAVAALAMLPLSGAGVARGATYETYSLTGYEVWFSPSVGTFVGTGSGADGDLAAWYSSIEHSGVVSPSGTITGGWASLYRLDGIRISGWFSGGTVELVDEGVGCTNELHAVRGTLTGVSRTDGTVLGTGFLDATLMHHRAWIFGRCISYSASVTATISVAF